MESGVGDTGHAVLLDTMVFSALAPRGREELRALYRPHVEGRRIVISFQTVAEVRFGVLKAGWGAARRSDLEDRIARAVVSSIDDALVTTYAQLRHTLVKQGHGLGQEVHHGDRWIAATALQYELPLVTHDRIFLDVPGLQVITALD